MADYVYENGELRHHGIIGMKWGVRRFQNKDGSRTAAGKKRYGDDADAEVKTKKAKAPKKRSIKDLSDEELLQRIKRLENEKKLKDLMKDDVKVNKGKEFVKDYALSAAKKILLDNATDIVSQMVKHYMADAGNKFIGDKDAKGKTIERVFANNKKKS